MAIPEHFTCLLRNLYTGQETTVRTVCGTMDWCKMGKEYMKAVYCHPVYLTYMQCTHVKWWAGWLTSWNQDCWENYQQPQICRWYHSNDRKRRGTKEPLNEDERREWKSWLKTQHSKNEEHGIQSRHFMANRWQNNGKKTLFSWAPKSLQMGTAAMKLKDTCSLEEKLWPT